jgi:hypothetical protein
LFIEHKIRQIFVPFSPPFRPIPKTPSVSSRAELIIAHTEREDSWGATGNWGNWEGVMERERRGGRGEGRKRRRDGWSEGVRETQVGIQRIKRRKT